MFDEIGKKIKKLAQVLCWIGIVVYILIALILFIISADSYEPEPLILTGFIIGVLGSFFSWLGSFIMYGFGELVDNSQKIKEKLILTESKTYKSKPPKDNPKFSSFTIDNLKINAVDTATSLGTCDLCCQDSVLIRECEIKDGFSKLYRKLCEKCISEHGGNLNTHNERFVTPAFAGSSIISASEIVSTPKKENTKMCLACGRVLPATQKECHCGSEAFDISGNV